jgi:hypothetical protein
MSEKITTLEEPNQLYANSRFFNSLPEDYKIVKYKLLNSMQLNQDETWFFNDGVEEQANVLLREIEIELSEIKSELAIVSEKIDTKNYKKADIDKFKKLAIRQIRLFDEKKVIVTEVDSLQIKTYF